MRIDAEDLDLTRLMRPDDLVVWGQACAEPVTLVERLYAQRAELSGVTCFLGIPAADTALAEYADHLRFVSFCGTGSNRALAAAGVLDVYPGHYSTLPAALTTGPLRADVVFVQCSGPDAEGRYSLGLADDYFTAAIDSARVVIAECNEKVPFTYGRLLTDDDIDVIVHTSREPAESISSRSGVDRLAANVAALVDDGATLQYGLGAIPEAVLAGLGAKNDLGFHSGMLSDGAVELIQRGVVTNACKPRDTGVSISGLLMGTRRLFDFADRNTRIELRPTSYTHDPQVLASIPRFVAINSAIEVDLTGQCNAEIARGQYVGAVGGGTDFLRGAARSPGGVPIIALPARAGSRSRIVGALSGPVSISRADAGVIVTEFGVADLRGLPLSQRRRAMIAIAHPDDRATLEETI